MASVAPEMTVPWPHDTPCPCDALCHHRPLLRLRGPQEGDVPGGAEDRHSGFWWVTRRCHAVPLHVPGVCTAALSHVPSWGCGTGQDPASVTHPQHHLGSFRHQPDAGGCSPAVSIPSGTRCCPMSLPAMGFVASGPRAMPNCSCFHLKLRCDPLERACGAGGRRERAEAFLGGHPWGCQPRAIPTVSSAQGGSSGPYMAGQGSFPLSMSSPSQPPTLSICQRRGKRSPGTSRARWQLQPPWPWLWHPPPWPRSWIGKPRWVLALGTSPVRWWLCPAPPNSLRRCVPPAPPSWRVWREMVVSSLGTTWRHAPCWPLPSGISVQHGTGPCECPSGGMGTPHGGDTRAHLLLCPSPRDSGGTKAKRDVPDVLEVLMFTKVRGSRVYWGVPAVTRGSLRDPGVLSSSPNATPTPIPPLWLFLGSDTLPPQTPIQESLIEFVDGGTSKLATEAFQGTWGTQVPHPPAPWPPPAPSSEEGGTGPGRADGVAWGGCSSSSPSAPRVMAWEPRMLPPPRGVCPQGGDRVSCVTAWLCHPQP